MSITKPNIKAIQEVLLTDMQKRIFKQYNDYKAEGNKILTDEDYDNTQSLLVDAVLNVNNMQDINDLLVEYNDLFTAYDELLVPTIDGTLNYIVGLLVEHAELNKCKC